MGQSITIRKLDGLEPLYAIEQREVTLRFDSEVPKGELVESGLGGALLTWLTPRAFLERLAKGRTRRLLVRAEREGIQWTARFDLPQQAAPNMSMESWSTKPRRRKPPDVFTHLLTRPQDK